MSELREAADFLGTLPTTIEEWDRDDIRVADRFINAYLATHDDRELTPELFREVCGGPALYVRNCELSFHESRRQVEFSILSSHTVLPHITTVWQLKSLIGLLTGNTEIK